MDQNLELVRSKCLKSRKNALKVAIIRNLYQEYKGKYFCMVNLILICDRNVIRRKTPVSWNIKFISKKKTGYFSEVKVQIV